MLAEYSGNGAVLPLALVDRSCDPRRMQVEIVAYDGFEELDALGPLSVLSLAGFDARLVTLEHPREVRGARGTVVVAERVLSPVPELILVPGGGWNDRADQGAWGEARRGMLPAAIRQRHMAGSRLAAVCTGAMLIAAAGLLNGRRAVTHHLALDELTASGAQVLGHARVVDDGEIVTAGGVTAGIDLALWLVERELGSAAAAHVADELEHPRIGTVCARPSSAAQPAAARNELALPDGPLAVLADSLARDSEPDYLYNHSVRSYLFARIAASERGLVAGRDFDQTLLFLSCVLHDIGLTEAADRGSRFEVDGADAAVQLLCANGLDREKADIVWQAIALHTSAGIAERRAPEVALTRAGIGIDFGRDAHIVDEQDAVAIHQRYPRLEIARNLTDAIVSQARGRPNKAPAYSLPGGLLEERSHDSCLTRLERQALASRWRE
jgi:putative intracellular protease/amidase